MRVASAVLLVLSLAGCATAGGRPAADTGLLSRARAACADEATRHGLTVHGWEGARSPLDGYAELDMRVSAGGQAGAQGCAWDDLRQRVQLMDPVFAGTGPDATLAAQAGAACAGEAARRGYADAAVTGVRPAGARAAEVQLRGRGERAPTEMRCTYDDGAGVTGFLADEPPAVARPEPDSAPAPAPSSRPSARAADARRACGAAARERGWTPGQVYEVRRLRGGDYRVRLEIVSDGRAWVRVCRYDTTTRAAAY